MSVKTISLTGTETAVTGLNGANAAIRNDSTDVIYTSKQPGITPGADGVLSIPAGGSAVLLGINSAVYITGTGLVILVTSDYNENPFKASAQGGSGADEVARAAITTHADDADIHVTADDKTNWNGKTTLSEAAQVFSNPNLLINPDFRINQRGKAQYTGKGYTADGWIIPITSVITQIAVGNSGGIHCETLKDIDSKGNVLLLQFSELDISALSGYITISAKIQEVSISAGTFLIRARLGDADSKYMGASTISLTSTSTPDIYSGSFKIPDNAATMYADINAYNCPAGSYADIKWIKVENSAVATPFIPPNPAEELVKCQRYYQIHSTGDIAAVDMRPSMREITDIKQREDGNYEYIAEL